MPNRRILSENNNYIELNILIRLRNHFKRKYQCIGIDRYKFFRNLFNKLINDHLRVLRDKSWAKILSRLQIRDNSLWSTLKSFKKKRVPIPPFTLNDDSYLIINTLL